MMESKYIAGEVVVGGMIVMNVAFVFAGVISHKAMAQRMGMEEVESAGFVRITPVDGKISIECYGSSHTLGVEADEEAVGLVAMCMGLNNDDWVSGHTPVVGVVSESSVWG